MRTEGTVSDDEYDLRDAIAKADLETMLPHLARYAEKHLRSIGWYSNEKLASHKLTPMELVDRAIDRCIAGKRHWKKGSNYPNLESFLRWVIRSLLSSAVKSSSRDQADLDDNGVVDPASDEPSPQDEVVNAERSAVVAAVECCAQDDNDLSDYYLTVIAGHTKPRDIASELGWDVARVNAARVKLQRRLEAQHPDLFGKMKKRRLS